PGSSIRRVGEDSPETPVPFEFPVIAKPGDSTAYNAVEFPGKHTVFIVPTPEKLIEILTSVRDSGDRGDFVLQERIPGPDSNLRTLTLYIDHPGEVPLEAVEHASLED